jgi:nicotinate-nucleotide adenylyltransferase
LKIGILGGSFNPAHAGHLHISKLAMRKMGLHKVWWLVSPGNPLKKNSGIYDYPARRQSALSVSKNFPRIMVSDFERENLSHYTFKTLKLLKARYPGTRFVWIMGADNLAIFHKWKNWQRIAEMIPIVVFDRSDMAVKALTSRMAIRYRQARVGHPTPQRIISRESAARTEGGRKAQWSFIRIRKHPESSSRIRSLAD